MTSQRRLESRDDASGRRQREISSACALSQLAAGVQGEGARIRVTAHRLRKRKPCSIQRSSTQWTRAAKSFFLTPRKRESNPCSCKRQLCSWGLGVNAKRGKLRFSLFLCIFSCSSPPYNPLSVRRVNPSALAFRLSSHRHSYISLLFSSRFIVSQ